MELEAAVPALSALAHAGRLQIFRLLIEAGPEGLAASEIARRAGSLPNTLSANLAVLSRAGLIASRRGGRWIFYSASPERLAELIAFLAQDCCGGRPEACGTLSEALGAVMARPQQPAETFR